MTPKEFERLYGQRRRQKDPGLPETRLLEPSGEVETYYLFADPAEPFRRLRVATTASEHLSSQVMGMETRIHETARLGGPSSTQRAEGMQITSLTAS